MCFSYTGHMSCSATLINQLFWNLILSWGPSVQNTLPSLFYFENLSILQRQLTHHYSNISSSFPSFLTKKGVISLLFLFLSSCPTSFLPTHPQWLIVFYLLCGTNDYRVLWSSYHVLGQCHNFKTFSLKFHIL